MPKSGSAARGYGAAHRRLRRVWAPVVACGGVECARCGRLILRGARWDLGHVDGDKTRYVGPEHASCNRSAGASFGNGRRVLFGKVRSEAW